jgi:hypothetical protein
MGKIIMINLIENDIWENKETKKSFKIIKCYYDEEIVEVQTSSSLTSREYSFKEIKESIILENLQKY